MFHIYSEAERRTRFFRIATEGINKPSD